MATRYLSLAALAVLAVAGCQNQPVISVVLGSSNINVLDPVQVRVQAYNPWGHQLEYRFAADRGFVNNQDLGAIGTYYAPFTGGADTIHVAVFDRFDGQNVAQQDVQVLVNGSSLVSVDTGGNTLGPFDNGTVKVSQVQGFGNTINLGQGRSPAISPDGRYLAYVKYVGDGTSQVYVRDPSGGERNITNHQSFNVDPSWAPVDSTRQLILAFSSDRISTGQGQSQAGHSDHYNIWRINVDTGDLRPVTSIAASARQPTFAPDGHTIAFSSNLDNNLSKDYWNLYETDLTTGKLTKLTAESTPTYGCYEPVFSPTGTRVAYTRKYLRPLLDQQVPLQKVFILDATAASLFPTAQSTTAGFGQFLMNQQDQTRVESAPSWSPDGSQVAFVQTIGTESRVFRVQSNPPGFGFGYDQMTDVGVFNAIEARWAWQNYSGGY